MKGSVKMDEIITAIANVGFPTVVSIYLLVRFESRITDLTNSINRLEQAINNVIK